MHRNFLRKLKSMGNDSRSRPQFLVQLVFQFREYLGDQVEEDHVGIAHIHLSKILQVNFYAKF